MGDIMIEIKRYRRRRNHYWIIMAFVSLPILMLSFLLITNISTMTFSDVGTFILPLGLSLSIIVLVIHQLNHIVFRVETKGEKYDFTTLIGRKVVVSPDQVIRILHSGVRYVIVLDNGKKLTFEKTDRFSFSFVIPVNGQDPWLQFLTKERFPKTEFGSLRLN